MIVYSRETVPKYTFGVVGFFAKRIRISWINLKARKKVHHSTLGDIYNDTVALFQDVLA